MNIILHDAFHDNRGLGEKKILRTMYLFDIDSVELIPHFFVDKDGNTVWNNVVLKIQKNQQTVNFLCLGYIRILTKFRYICFSI